MGQAVVSLPVLLVDKRLRPAPNLPERFVRKRGLTYFTSGENEDYLAEDILLLSQQEADETLRAGNELFELLRQTARHALSDTEQFRLLGIPDWCRPLLQWSVQHEWDDYLFGRFDFAGGFDGQRLRLIEFNADTSSLLPETAVLQPEILRKARLKAAPNRLADSLKETFRRIGAARKGTVGLGSYLGYEEDLHNLDVLTEAARSAGWKQVDTINLPSVIFDPDAGLLVELQAGSTTRYYYLIKYFPWDWIALEESSLWEMLEEMITSQYVRVLNPAWSMLLQSKALMALAYRAHPGNPLLLPTVFDPADLPDPRRGYVRKPIFGRTGENVMVSLDGRRADAENDGDFGQQPVIYQELASFATDEDGFRYQLSTFMTPEASALACRAQDGLILDDDADFVSLGILR